MHGLGAGMRRQQAPDQAADAGNAAMKEHEHNGRQSN
jgi:hypothetical protein